MGCSANSPKFLAEVAGRFPVAPDWRFRALGRRRIRAPCPANMFAKTQRRKFGPVDSLAHRSTFAPNSPDFGAMSADAGELFQFRTLSADFVRFRPISGEFDHLWRCFDQCLAISAKFGPFRPNVYRCRATSGEFGQVGVDFSRFRASSANFGTTSPVSAILHLLSVGACDASG